MLWNQKVHYSVLKGPLLDLVLGLLNPFNTLTPYFLTINVNVSSPLRLDLPSISFRLGFPTKMLYAFLIYPIYATSLGQLIIVDLMMILISREEYKLCGSHCVIFSILSFPLSYY
jgi:hypothetical protein